MLEIKINGKKGITIDDNNQTFIHDNKIAEEINKLSDKNKKPDYTIIEG